MVHTECPNGKYGHNCEENCSINCMFPGNCDNVAGHCIGGCKAGWKNTQCDQGKIWNVIKKSETTCRTFVSCQPQNEILSLRPI